ncbi:MAG: OB-fold nucleic acid binding domain-containing protein [Gammaproteobacteria bacterium]|nr:OB-fold nucleic acid binding domain-containing protein [Gammaproteobacteria bacterium]
MAEQRAIFIAGAIKRGVDHHVANNVFDLMEKFAAYGFNKSHSVAYALIAYQTAWLKAHHPAALMAAVLIIGYGQTLKKLFLMVKEAKAMNISLALPNINQGVYTFTLDHQGGIIYGLGAIKGVGEAAIQMIVAEREKKGPYTDLFSFCERNDLQKCNRRALEALIKSGAMDVFEVPRGRMFASLDNAMLLAEKKKRDLRHQQLDLFSQAPAFLHTSVSYVACNPWNEYMRLQAEKEVLGWYASGHPVRHYATELSYMVTSTFAQLQEKYRHSPKMPYKSSRHIVTIAGVIVALRTMMTKKGQRMAFVTLDDGISSLELAVFSDIYTQYRDDIVDGRLIIVTGEVSWDTVGEQLRLRAQSIQTLEQARIQHAKAILLHISADDMTPEMLRELEKILFPYQGGHCPVYVDYWHDNQSTRILMGEKWAVTPHHALIDALCLLLSEDGVSVGY